jgi:general transcription factor 3C polypeptide 5 (transcription factor C subunit 1)
MGRRDHIFDGQILNRDKPDYQLCDIEDELIKRYINDERLITDHCDVSSPFPSYTN